MAEKYVGVCLLDAPHALDRVFDYRVPDALSETVAEGSFVTVPFGRGNLTKNGIILYVSDRTEAKRVKEIRAVLPPETRLSQEMLALAAYLKEHTLCTTGDAVRVMVPAGLTDAERPSQVKETRYYSVAVSKEILTGLIENRPGLSYKTGSEGQRMLLRAFLSAERIEEHVLLSEYGGTKVQLDALVRRGILAVESETRWRGMVSKKSDPAPREIELSEEQAAAYASL
ncbi:MAG: hypothetical protein J6B77_03600, partial [Clostridia bacterium]|nr:hypothetical protein [Clostridia bacterium]